MPGGLDLEIMSAARKWFLLNAVVDARRIFFPKRCYLTKKLLFPLTTAVRMRTLKLEGVRTEWADPKEYTIFKLKGM